MLPSWMFLRVSLLHFIAQKKKLAVQCGNLQGTITIHRQKLSGHKGFCYNMKEE